MLRLFSFLQHLLFPSLSLSPCLISLNCSHFSLFFLFPCVSQCPAVCFSLRLGVLPVFDSPVFSVLSSLPPSRYVYSFQLCSHVSLFSLITLLCLYCDSSPLSLVRLAALLPLCFRCHVLCS